MADAQPNPPGPTAVAPTNPPSPAATAPEARPDAQRAADIIRFPHGYGHKGDAGRTMAALKKEFGPLLGNPKAVWFGRNGPFTLAHATSFEPLYFPKGSERDGEERFRWEQKDGYEVGYFVEGANDAVE